MYVAGFVIPVPAQKMEAYRRWAENGAALFREYGCIEIVESWEDNVPTGTQSDFRRAVAAQDSETSCSPGRYGPTRRHSGRPKPRCRPTSAWGFRMTFRSTRNA
jgi:uncharacterized protein YbaA (DUF1428 family)